MKENRAFWFIVILYRAREAKNRFRKGLCQDVFGNIPKLLFLAHDNHLSVQQSDLFLLNFRELIL